MRKIALLLALSGIIFNSVLSQKVDSIKVEQSGDFIKVRYKILDSRPDQVYSVKVLCSINGGLNTELRSISGDAGDHVPGGKPEYWVVWDVLKDVDEVKSVDFIVRAELEKSIGKVPKSTKVFNFQPSIQLPGPTFGVRMGLMGKFGVSVQFVRGMGVLLRETLYTDQPVFNRFSADFTSRIANEKNTQLHLLTGFTVGNTVIKETYTSVTSSSTSEAHFKKAMTPGLEIGFALCTNRLIFSLTGAKLLTGLTEEGKSISKNTYAVFSVGFRL
jgi:hypothetical protein